MKIYWDLIDGCVTVKVRAINHEDKFEEFTFDCFISSEVNSYDKLENVMDAAYHLALLRNLYRAEIIDVKLSK
jgi:hypothetical protein